MMAIISGVSRSGALECTGIQGNMGMREIMGMRAGNAEVWLPPFEGTTLCLPGLSVACRALRVVHAEFGGTDHITFGVTGPCKALIDSSRCDGG